MKSITIALFVILLSLEPLSAQNDLYIKTQIGTSFLIQDGPQSRRADVYFFSLLEDVSWDKKLYPSVSLGITYETPVTSLWGNEFYFKTDLNLEYKNYHPNFYEAILISNNFYLPIKQKKKRLRMHLGVKNAFVIADFTPEENREFFSINRHQFGALVLFNYKFNKINIGLNIYGDIKTPIFNDISGGRFRTFNTALRVAYKINN